MNLSSDPVLGSMHTSEEGLCCSISIDSRSNGRSHGNANKHELEKSKTQKNYVPPHCIPPSQAIPPQLEKHPKTITCTRQKKRATSSLLAPGYAGHNRIVISAYRPCPRCEPSKPCESRGIRPRLSPTGALDDRMSWRQKARDIEPPFEVNNPLAETDGWVV